MRIKLRTVRDVEGELKLLENSLERLRQSFSLEKDASLEQETLENLREREKCHYQPRVEGVPFTIFLRMKELEKNLKEARAHFTGTVNRLIRCAGPEPGENECIE